MVKQKAFKSCLFFSGHSVNQCNDHCTDPETYQCGEPNGSEPMASKPEGSEPKALQPEDPEPMAPEPEASERLAGQGLPKWPEKSLRVGTGRSGCTGSENAPDKNCFPIIFELHLHLVKQKNFH